MTDAPATNAPIYTFDKLVPAFGDEYVSLVLPAGQSLITDGTYQYVGLYKRYIVFSDPDNSAGVTSYYVQNSEAAGSTLYAKFSRQDFENIFKLFYEQNLGSSVTISTRRYESLSFESESGKSVEGVIYDYVVEHDGADVRQLIYSVVIDGAVSVTLAFGFPPDAQAPDPLTCVTVT